MNTIKRQLGLMLCGALAAAGIWSCEATKNADGSWSYKFAPDMTITAWGLEDALGKLTDLLDKCITGNFSRPCTQSEMDAVNKAIETVTNKKEKIVRGSPLGSFGPGRAG